MLASLVASALRFRVLVLVLAGALVFFGARAVQHAPLDVFPEFAPPQAEIQTEAPGLSTEEVDALVTVPLENSLNGLPWLKTIRSKSVLGLSSVVMIFQDGTDLMRARQLVQERLALAQGRLPQIVKPPVLMAPHSSLSRAMKIGLSSKTLTQMDLSELSLWKIRPRLMAIPGVANVAIWGQRDKQYQVLVDPGRLRTHGVTLDAVMKAASDATTLTPGGFIDTPNQRLAVRQLTAISGADDIARSVVAFRDGTPLRLGDVAEVVTGHPPPIGDAVINDGPGILLIVEKQPWGNTLDVSREVERVMKALQPALPGVEIDTTIFRPATFIEQSIANLTEALWLGCGLVVAILVLFLFSWRSAVISITAIPLSLLAAVLVLAAYGQTLNTMVIAGLVIALGEVVDDAIIDVENIVRRLRLNAALSNPLPKYQVVLNASLEVRSAVVYATFIVGLVCLPVFFLDGLAGSFFRPLALAYLLAILASLMVALTVTPAMCLMLLHGNPGRHFESPLARLCKAVYRAVLPFFVSWPKVAVIFLIASFAGTWTVWKKLGEEFLPNFQERDFLMHWVEKPAIGIDAMTRITILASKELRTIPGVRNFGSHIGRAEVADEVVGPNFTELWISVSPDVPYKETVAKIQETVDGYPGLYRDLQTYLRERVKEVLTGASGSIVVRIFGPDLAVLRERAEAAGKVMGGIEGVTALKVEPQSLVPHVQVTLLPEAVANFGLTPGAVRAAVTTLVKGAKAGEVFEEQKIHEVTVWGAQHVRSDIQSLRELLIETPAGAHVPLGDVARIEIIPTPNEIKREGASRRIDVTCNVADGRDLGSVAREIESKVRELSFPAGYHPEFLGEFAARAAAQQRLIYLSIAALIGILALLQADFQSARLTLLVGLTLPFALIGGVLAVKWSGGVLSLGSLIGFVTVLGIAARNGIMLVSHYRHLQEDECMEPGLALVLRGAEERLIPILMTALCAALALLPLVLRGNLPGHEIEYPMAVVIVGGLATSTVMNLLLLPALAFGFGGFRAPVRSPS